MDDGRGQLKNIDDVAFLNKSNVRIKNKDVVLKKLNSLISAGKDHLQVITDYDLTLTKQHSNGKRTLSSFGLICLCKTLPPKFIEKDKELMERYYPIERDPNMPLSEKIPHMVKWYNESQQLFTGVPFDIEELDRVIDKQGPDLRDGTVELCNQLKTEKIPVLVLSAGLGNVLQQVLKYHQLEENTTFHIVSNFFKFDNGMINGFGCQENGEFLHSCNKNGLGCVQYFKKLGTDRYNVIILGDSLGDASMDQGVPELQNTLKIGFLYGTNEAIAESLPKFLNKFDIVLIDDQTMTVPQAVLNLVIQGV